MCCGRRGFSRVIEYKQLVQCVGAVGRKQASDMRNSQWISSLLAQGTHGLICHHELISIWQTLVHKRLLICSLDSEGEGGASSSVLPSGKDQMWSLKKNALGCHRSKPPASRDLRWHLQHPAHWDMDVGPWPSPLARCSKHWPVWVIESAAFQARGALGEIGLSNTYIKKRKKKKVQLKKKQAWESSRVQMGKLKNDGTEVKHQPAHLTAEAYRGRDGRETGCAYVTRNIIMLHLSLHLNENTLNVHIYTSPIHVKAPELSWSQPYFHCQVLCILTLNSFHKRTLKMYAVHADPPSS